MKHKIAKRSASQYQDSLSSQSSCHDSIIVHAQSSSITGRLSSSSSIMVVQGCWTPPKNTSHPQQSFSIEKLTSNSAQQWEIEKIGEPGKEGFWGYQSQDSKIRSKQDNSSGQIKKKCKQHIKMLRFDDERYSYEFEKQNEPIRINNDECSSDGEVEQWSYLREGCKRVVGRVLYFDQNCYKNKGKKLHAIAQEDSQMEENCWKGIRNF